MYILLYFIGVILHYDITSCTLIKNPCLGALCREGKIDEKTVISNVIAMIARGKKLVGDIVDVFEYDKQEQDKLCVKACLDNIDCRSANYVEEMTNFKCELLKDDYFSRSDKIENDELSNHLYFKGPCEDSPCKNGGSCLPNYKNDTFICKCTDLYEGVYCKEKNSKIRSLTDHVIFNFEDESTSNSGNEDYIEMELDSGIIANTPERYGKSLYCKDTNCLKDVKFTQYQKDIFDGTYLKPINIEVMFDIKMKRRPSSDKVYILSNEDGFGLKILFNYTSSTWNASFHLLAGNVLMSVIYKETNPYKWHSMRFFYDKDAKIFSLLVDGEAKGESDQTEVVISNPVTKIKFLEGNFFIDNIMVNN